MIILYVLLAIVVLLIMIMIHETGHYLVGKLLHFKIEEFSVGFGKPIFQKTLKSGEVFSLRWIPLGGFCAFKGEDEDEDENEVTEEEKKEYFNSQAPWKRLLVLVAGATFNFLSAIIFSLILLLSVGSGICKVTNVLDDSTNLGVLQKNDIILEVEGVDPTFINGGLSSLMSSKEVGEDIVLKINRDGEIMDIVVTKYQTYKMDDDGNYELDDKGEKIVEDAIIGINTEYVKLGFGEALLKCVPYTFNMAWECIKVFANLITGSLGLKGTIESVGGPITTVSTIATSTQASLKNLLLLFPLISVNLAVFNLFPIPALDGARAVFVLIEWIFKKPVPREIEGRIHTIGLFVLFGLVIILDLLHLFLV